MLARNRLKTVLNYIMPFNKKTNIYIKITDFVHFISGNLNYFLFLMDQNQVLHYLV